MLLLILLMLLQWVGWWGRGGGIFRSLEGLTFPYGALLAPAIGQLLYRLSYSSLLSILKQLYSYSCTFCNNILQLFNFILSTSLLSLLNSCILILVLFVTLFYNDSTLDSLPLAYSLSLLNSCIIIIVLL